jgi:hypothetical protein
MKYIPTELEFRQAYEEFLEEENHAFWFRVQLRAAIFIPVVGFALTLGLASYYILG